MRIRVNCELDIAENERELDIKEKDLVGKTYKESVEYIFDNIITPFIIEHMIISYDVIQY